MKTPYIGITGFMNQDEVISVLNVFLKETEKRLMTESDRLLMVGVLMSQKTLKGLDNKWPNRYPKTEEIRRTDGGIFLRHPFTLSLIHYNTKEKDTLFHQMKEISALASLRFDGFQLNVSWPSPFQLEKYRNEPVNHGEVIVLQVGGGAFKKVGNSPKRLAEKVRNEYLGLVDYVLLDPSGGQGRPFDTQKARECLEELQVKGIDKSICLGVAGGLSPDTLGLVEPLVADFPDLCIDAEGRLRDENDNLNLETAKDYIKKALTIFKD